MAALVWNAVELVPVRLLRAIGLWLLILRRHVNAKRRQQKADCNQDQHWRWQVRSVQQSPLVLFSILVVIFFVVIDFDDHARKFWQQRPFAWKWSAPCLRCRGC